MVDTIQNPTQPTGSHSQAEKTFFKSDEGHDLIASNRVEGTKVYRPDGTKLGQVHHFMVGKRNGRVEYAVLSFGGFLGLGKELPPVPWDVLDYDTEQNGYVISAEEDVLKDAPYIQEGKSPMWDRAFGAHIYGYWGVTY